MLLTEASLTLRATIKSRFSLELLREVKRSEEYKACWNREVYDSSKRTDKSGAKCIYNLFKVDMFGFGMTLHTLATLDHPWYCTINSFEKAIKYNVELLHYSPKLLYLFSSMLSFSKRIDLICKVYWIWPLETISKRIT